MSFVAAYGGYHGGIFLILSGFSKKIISMDFMNLAGTEYSDRAYEAAIESLFAQVPTFQRVGASAYKPGLEASVHFDEKTGYPSRAFRSIHIAGTNGKGSTSSMIAAVLQSAGYRTALYTSPHLVDFRERMKIDGKMVPKEYVFGFLKKWGDYIIREKISFFEITTAMAFSWFRDSHVDVAVIETGLGGRLDSTNIIVPELSVITNIGLDHCEFLGHTLPEIAAEKAGIIKPGVPAVLGESSHEYDSVFERKAEECGSPLYKASQDETLSGILGFLGVSSAGEVRCGLTGSCQKKNIRTVLAALSVLGGFSDGKARFAFTKENVIAGMENVASLTGLRGRWECLCRSPRVYCDTGHNAHGLKYVFSQLENEKYGKLYIVFGVVADKDLDSVIPLMPKDAYYLFTNARGTRALKAEILAQRLGAAGMHGEIVPDVRKAYERALQLAGKDDFVYIGGSTFVVAEVLEEKNGADL